MDPADSPKSLFNPTNAPEIADVTKRAILNQWSVPMIDGGAECDTLSTFLVHSMGNTYSVTIRKEISA